ncbi:CAP-associated domain-containing protein [Solibacillus sp. FSL W8-0372]|uniref:CAP domain-containing protein n=1 Tax=Solibacillus sp. FSL W8-0372 TaxID=2921713 RepID=UPI0030CC87CD
MNQDVLIPLTTESTVVTKTTAIKIFASEYDFEWSIPSLDYNQFHLIGTKNNIAVAGYETRIGQAVCGISIGDSRQAVKAQYGEPITHIIKNNRRFRQYYDDKYNAETSGTYLIDHQYVTFFYDVHKNFQVRSIMAIDTETEMSKVGFFAAPSPALRDGFEDLMMDLINASRVSEGLLPLQYTPEYNAIARSHSLSMATYNYFGHMDMQGLRGGARMKNGGMAYDWWGENLACGQYSAIYAHEALMNSLTHRENILREQFTHAFVGVEFNTQSLPYFTINFYSL